jgi:aldehyde:ferredoxin oxidoreductase
MQCGHIIKDSSGQGAELDYENVGMLGPNIGLGNLPQVALLNRLADEWGLDTISLGSCIGFLMEASEKGLIKEKVRWGDIETAQKLVTEIGKGEGLGKLVSQGVKAASEILGKGSQKWAMQVKGLEISAHKDAWIISWEIANDRFSYDKSKVEKLIEFQRLRGGFFESATVCRLPWVEVSFGLDRYPEYLEAITGRRMAWEDLFEMGDRIYALIRAYWKREVPQFGRKWDYPPDRWFEEPHSGGKMKGVRVDREKYEQMLTWYYELRGWDQNGIPLKESLDRFGLKDVSKEIIEQVG